MFGQTNHSANCAGTPFEFSSHGLNGKKDKDHWVFMGWLFSNLKSDHKTLCSCLKDPNKQYLKISTIVKI